METSEKYGANELSRDTNSPETELQQVLYFVGKCNHLSDISPRSATQYYQRVIRHVNGEDQK